ncbi:MAG TPA: histidine phosphatase family protein [Thermodesulfobacteriota bacterium]|nr:histidine phosphatase family protein [Thermodesulfobacteriota bacterium]
MSDNAKTAKIFLGRHCKTEWNLEGRLIGTTDLPLCDVGWNEAKDTLPIVEKYKFDRIVSSPLKRAFDTSRYYADNLKIPLEVNQDLRELDHGDWNGKKYDDLLSDPNGDFKRWFIDGDTSIPIPNGPETLEQVQARIKRTIREIALKYPGEKVLVIMHKHIRSLLTCYFVGESLSNFRKNINEAVDPIELSDEDLKKLI